MKVLVVTSEPVDADRLRAELGHDPGEDAEVMVVAPALHESRLRFWMSDADDAIARAQSVKDETVRELEAEGVAAAGDTGEGDPLEAVEDALTTFPADRILLFTHPPQKQSYREDVDPAQLQERFGIPVQRSVVGQ